MTRKNTLKKLLMYLVVLVGVLFVGFMAYYFGVNNETIALTIKEGDVIYMNVDDVIRLPVEHIDAHRGTEINVSSSDNDVAYYSAAADTIIAKEGGVATFTVTPSNTKFGPFRFDVLVGDGSFDNPWYISTAAQFAQIGKPVTQGNEWTVYHSYELLNDINLIETFTPLNAFYGTFAGEGHTISNLRVLSANANVGIFGTLSTGAKFENVILSNLSVTSTNTSAVAVGGIAGVNNGFIGKVQLTGTITSASEIAYVGGIAGKNNFEGSRPTISTVMATVNLRANGTVGGLVGQNMGGIIFNAIADVKSLDMFIAEIEPLSVQLDSEPSEINFLYGGIAGHSSAVIYGTENTFRQSAVKNVIARTDATVLLARDAEFVNKLALVAFLDTEIGNDVHTYAVKNVFLNIIVQSISGANSFVTQNGAETSSITVISSTQYTSADTYAGLSDVWVFDSNLRKPVINMGVSYEMSAVSDPGNTITSGAELVNAIVTITNSMEKEISYKINAASAPNHEIVVDANDIMTARGLTSWIPIGTKANPYKGKLIVENGYLVIENLTITSTNETYIGFFGVISGVNTEIRNIKFRNVNISTTNTFAYAGVLAGSIDQGYITNIVIDNATITNAKHAGFLTGILLDGIVENVAVGANYQDGHENLITNSLSLNNYYGGIAGTSGGTIRNVEIDNATLNQEKVTSTFMGGIIGKLLDKSTLKNAYNKGAELNSKSEQGYFGGVVGYMSANTLVESSYNKGTILNIIGTEEFNYAGGITAYLGEGGTISRSFSDTISIKNKYVGGIATFNHGTIRESYSLGEYSGQYVGGLSYLCTGQIVHSYTRASLYSSGNKDTYSVAGLSVWLPKGAKIQYVFSAAVLQAPYGAIKFAETRSAFRYNGVESFFSGKDGGEIENYIVIGYGDAVVQSTNWNATWRSIGWADLPKEFIQTDETSVKGMGATNPFEQVGFFNYSPQIWKFATNEWPELTNVVVAG